MLVISAESQTFIQGEITPMLTSKMMFHFFLRKAAWICPFRESVAIFALSCLTVKIKIIKAKKQKAQTLMKKTPKNPQNQPNIQTNALNKNTKKKQKFAVW